MKKIVFNLNQRSIQNAIKELQSYKKEFQRKNEEFVKRLSEIGIDVINQTMQSIPSEERGDYNTEIITNTTGDVVGAAIRLTGENVMFIEFSSGVRYGSPTGSYPLPSGKEYGVGTYPGQTHAYDPHGWWYIDENGEKHHSYGNRAYMPMYLSEVAIIMSIRQIAKEVFKS